MHPVARSCARAAREVVAPFRGPSFGSLAFDGNSVSVMDEFSDSCYGSSEPAQSFIAKPGGRFDMADTAELKELKAYLAALPPGDLAERDARLIDLLKGCWDQLEGSDSESMAAYKLSRIEEVSWQGPILRFTIERHGGTVLGSSRGELQSWRVDLDNTRADCEKNGRYRQLRPKAPPVNVKPIAVEIAEAIFARRNDDRLKWQSGGAVRVLTGKVFPSAFGQPKQTVSNRRKRLRQTLDEILAEHGWRKIRSNIFTPPSV